MSLATVSERLQSIQLLCLQSQRIRLWRSLVRNVSIQDKILPTPLVLEANDEAGAFVWTVYEMGDCWAPGALHKYWAQGQGVRVGRDQFDVCACSLSEIDPCL